MTLHIASNDKVIDEWYIGSGLQGNSFSRKLSWELEENKDISGQSVFQTRYQLQPSAVCYDLQRLEQSEHGYPVNHLPFTVSYSVSSGVNTAVLTVQFAFSCDLPCLELAVMCKWALHKVKLVHNKLKTLYSKWKRNNVFKLYVC